MNRFALALTAAITAGAGGYVAGAPCRSTNAASLQERAAQQEQWDSIHERLEEISLCGRAAARQSLPAAAAPPVPSVALDEAVDRVLDERERRAETEAEAETAPSDENFQAFAEGEQLVEDALATGTWSETQRASFRELLTQVSAEQGEHLRRRLAVAVNEDQLILRTGGPPI